MSLSLIRDKIQAALSTIDKLEVYKSVPTVVNPPCAFFALRPNDTVDYDFTAANGTMVYHAYIEVLVNKGGTIEQAQDQLDDYLMANGDKSIRAALEGIDWTDAADAHRVSGVSNYGDAVYNGISYLGARLAIDIWRTNSWQ